MNKEGFGQEITGAVLAGGRASRMGGTDKGLVPLAGRPMVAHVLERLRPQVGTVLINANRNRDAYGQFGYPVVSDELADFQGPLAGIAATLARVETPWTLILPCDAPLLPRNFAARLYRAAAKLEADVAVAHDGTRLQPAHALLRTALLPDLLEFLAAGERRIAAWYRRHTLAQVDFADCPEAFLNVNTLAERDALAVRMTEGMAG